MKKTEQKLATEVLDMLVYKLQEAKALGIDNANRKVGAYVENLGPVKRQILKGLKSEDIENIRPDSIFIFHDYNYRSNRKK